jgi:hypothetical protein
LLLRKHDRLQQAEMISWPLTLAKRPSFKATKSRDEVYGPGSRSGLDFTCGAELRILRMRDICLSPETRHVNSEAARSGSVLKPSPWLCGASLPSGRWFDLGSGAPQTLHGTVRLV